MPTYKFRYKNKSGKLGFFFFFKAKIRKRKIKPKMSIAKSTRLPLVLITAVPSDPRKRPKKVANKLPNIGRTKDMMYFILTRHSRLPHPAMALLFTARLVQMGVDVSDLFSQKFCTLNRIQKMHSFLVVLIPKVKESQSITAIALSPLLVWSSIFKPRSTNSFTKTVSQMS